MSAWAASSSRSIQLQPECQVVWPNEWTGLQGGPGWDRGKPGEAKGRGCRGPGQQAHPHRHFGDVSWEAEAAPSLEQEGETGRPGARPYATPQPGPEVLGAKPPPQPGATFQEPACPPQQGSTWWGAGLKPTPLQATEGKEAGGGGQAQQVCNALRGLVAPSPHTTLYSVKPSAHLSYSSVRGGLCGGDCASIWECI